MFAGNPTALFITEAFSTPLDRNPLGPPPVSHITRQFVSLVPAELVIQPS